MTPEERADNALTEAASVNCGVGDLRAVQIYHVAETIRAAEAQARQEEREACLDALRAVHLEFLTLGDQANKLKRYSTADVQYERADAVENALDAIRARSGA